MPDVNAIVFSRYKEQTGNDRRRDTRATRKGSTREGEITEGWPAITTSTKRALQPYNATLSTDSNGKIRVLMYTAAT